MEPKLEYKSATAQAQEVSAEKGILRAVVSVFDTVDTKNDIIRQGAYKSSIENWKKTGEFPVGLLEHSRLFPLAKTLEAYEAEAGSSELPTELKDYGGLVVTAQFDLKNQAASAIYTSLLHNTIKDGYSVGIRTLESNKIDGGIREITNVDWQEWSVVDDPANINTRRLELKSTALTLDETLRLLHLTKSSDEATELLRTLVGILERREIPKATEATKEEIEEQEEEKDLAIEEAKSADPDEVRIKVAKLKIASGFYNF